MVEEASTASWEAAPILPVVPPPGFDDTATIHTEGAAYWECGSSGWHLMVGWLAGPDTLARYPENRELITTETTETGEIIHQRPETPGERQWIEESDNGYLKEIGIPPRPHGFRWFQRLPDGLTPNDVMDAAGRAEMESGLPGNSHPREAVPFIRKALREIYHTNSS